MNIIEDCYSSYLKADKDGFDRWLRLDSSIVAKWTPYRKEEFINKIKTDPEFSEKMGINIEERELSLKERMRLNNTTEDGIDFILNSNNFKGIDAELEANIFLDYYKAPTKKITVTYKNETIEIYE